MTATILDGKRIASQQQNTLKTAIETYTNQGHRAPGLAVILLGTDPASALYVAKKRKACSDAGLESFAYHLPTETTQQALLSLIHTLNQQEEVDGILVQLPLPKHIDADAIIEAIKPSKDVDGFHPYNFGRLAQGNPTLRPCTPYGVIQLLHAYNIPIKGKKAVVIGKSNIVGRPMALEFLLAGATVSVCHRLTRELDAYVSQADIVVSATGVRHVIELSWLNSKQILIDVGIHRLDDLRICGDIDFEQARHRVAWITPVPGGVGPMTVATLLNNTFQAYKSSLQSNSSSNSPS